MELQPQTSSEVSFTKHFTGFHQNSHSLVTSNSKAHLPFNKPIKTNQCPVELKKVHFNYQIKRDKQIKLINLCWL